MQLLELPDETLFNICKFLVDNENLNSVTPGEDTFNYDSNVQYILTSNKFQNIVELSLTCRKLRILVTLFLQTSCHLQLSLVRISELPNLIEFRRLKLASQKAMIPIGIGQYSLSLHIIYLEICLNFIDDQLQWCNLVDIFKKITSLKLLGNSEHYKRIFESNSNIQRFNNLQNVSLPLPSISMAMIGLSKAINWSQLTKLSLFVDPFGNLTINAMTNIMDLLQSEIQEENQLAILNLFGGNNIIYTDGIMLKSFEKLLIKLTNLKSLSILHRQLRTPAFSTYGNDYQTSFFQYHDLSHSFTSFFKAIRDLPHLETLILDIGALRLFHQEFNRVFYEVRFHTGTLNLTLVEPTFVYPMPTEQMEEILMLILTVQATSVSFKLGIQIEIPTTNYIILLIHELLKSLTTRFNYTRLATVDYELCWSIMEDSYVLEHNELHEDDRLLRWQRPHIASSLYKQMETQEIAYASLYDDEQDVNYPSLMRSMLVKYPLCSYELSGKRCAADEGKRLQFWRVRCDLDDHVELNQLGNRKGGIFD